MILRERPPIRLTLEAFAKYKGREADIAYLAAQLAAAMSLLEGDIPKPIREAIRWAEANVDSIRFGTHEQKEYDEVQRVWREVEEVIARHVGGK